MAGLEERLSKLESILHRLFCCDTNQFTGPQGPQGPQGNPGLQGPPGPQGAVGPAGLEWQGEWVPCTVYNQNDAVGYEGASYYVTCENSDSSPCYSYIVTGTGSLETTDCNGDAITITGGLLPQIICVLNALPSVIQGLTFTPTTAEDCPSTACAPPNVNPCFALLANQGAEGPQGPAGIGISGNDGSNSGRWKFKSVGNTPVDPGSTYFVGNSSNLNALSKIFVSNGDINSTSYQDWWIFLHDIYADYAPLILLQITEVGSNNIIGIYQLDSKYASPILINGTYVEVYLDPMYVGNGTFSVNKDYTITWSIHGGINGGNAPKTEGIVTPVLNPGPYPTLQYDYNELNTQPVSTPGTIYHAALPVPTSIGQTLVVRALGSTSEYDKSPGIVSHDGSPIINLNTTLTDSFTLYNTACMRFTWSGTYWVAEDIQGYETTFNNFTPVNTLYNIIETLIDASIVYPTKVYLNTTYPSSTYARGIKVYCPYIPGGPKVFTKISDAPSNEWASYPYTPVI